MDAVAADKDVYVEKPVTHSLEEGMIRSAPSNQASGGPGGTQQRSWPHSHEGKRIIDSGKLGKITFDGMWWFQNYAAGEYRPSSRSTNSTRGWLGKPRSSVTPIKFLWWRWFWDFGGGALTDLMTHWIDVAHWYMDVTAPASVVTNGDQYALDWECPDTITCALDYPKNSASLITARWPADRRRRDGNSREERDDEARPLPSGRLPGGRGSYRQTGTNET